MNLDIQAFKREVPVRMYKLGINMHTLWMLDCGNTHFKNEIYIRPTTTVHKSHQTLQKFGCNLIPGLVIEFVSDFAHNCI